MIDICLTKRDVCDPFINNTMFCLEEGFPGDIDRDKFRPGAVFGEYCGLGTNTARSFEHTAPRGIAGVVVEQPG